jgi:predicted TIM-barrel fold metal-dependent hydrolase
LVIDFAAHILPPRYLKGLLESAGERFPFRNRIAGLPGLTDLDVRRRVMDSFAARGYRQVLTLASPPPESVTTAARTAELYHLGNEEMRELVERHPDHFVAALGNLPLNDPDAARLELDHVVALGLPGVQLFSNVGGVPLDHPSILPVVEDLLGRGLVVFLHPTRNAAWADYPGESRSRFDIWQTFGWPYETTVTMMRLAFAGLFDRLPEAAIVTHHLGAMVPYFSERVRSGYRQLTARDPAPEDLAAFERLKRPPIDYMQMFYGDTAVWEPNAIRCGLAFFGPGHVVFGSDTPYDWSDGAEMIRKTLAAVDALDLPAPDREAIFEGNARRLLSRAAP